MAGETVVVCVDGSGFGDNAFNHAVKYARKNDTIVIIHVPEYDVSMSALGSDWEKVVEEVKKKDAEVDSFTLKYMTELRQKGINCKAVKPKGGKAGEVIVNEARKEGATQIIMGTRGLGLLQRALLGSVSQYVLNHAEIPVTIIPGKK